MSLMDRLYAGFKNATSAYSKVRKEVISLGQTVSGKNGVGRHTGIDDTGIIETLTRQARERKMPSLILKMPEQPIY